MSAHWLAMTRPSPMGINNASTLRIVRSSFWHGPLPHPLAIFSLAAELSVDALSPGPNGALLLRGIWPVPGDVLQPRGRIREGLAAARPRRYEVSGAPRRSTLCAITRVRLRIVLVYSSPGSTPSSTQAVSIQ